MAENATHLPIKNDKKTPPSRSESWQPFDNLRREIDRVFDDFLPMRWRSPFMRQMFDTDMPRLPTASFQIMPAIDVAETEKAFEVSAELPGMDAKDIEIKLTNGSLVIKGEKSAEREKTEKEYHLSERSYGAFQRSFQLPDSIDRNAIEATFKRGVLKVSLPKSAEAKRSEKKIDVKAA